MLKQILLFSILISAIQLFSQEEDESKSKFCNEIDNKKALKLYEKATDKKKLFERYYRVEDIKSKHISGFGIGLYLSAEIVHRHGGEICVESQIGIGSEFFFRLPINGRPLTI